ncbi:hypothetical protein M0R45_002944 [Rubus argutus]|uniref:GTD-binding domain-containing protein n=1 Tax=Rubus argutus TaxID=59490 RepID=A0AAW1YF21_RUBAR
MAEYSGSFGMPETDITALTEALKSQQQLLQKLYADLDQEREASSTAADEALSMILRLQGEKSAVKMEANQYKRLAEEKICHAEEALAIFEDLIYQKEMEIASLEFQLQAYRYKLLSLGVSTELGAGENVYPENLLLQRGDHATGEQGGVGGTIRRINSLPPIELKDFLNKKCSMERERESDSLLKERPIIPKPESAMKKGDKKVDKEVTFQGFDPEKKAKNSSQGNLNSIWEQIKKLDDRVKEISDCKDSGGGRGISAMLKGPSRTCSLPPIPKVITSTSHDTEREDIIATIDQVNHNENVQEREAIVSTSCFTGVHDIFEVPQSYDSPKDFEGEKKEFSKLTLEVENRLGKHDLVCNEISEVHVQDETQRVKKMFHGKLENRLLSRTSTVDSNARERVAAAVSENQARFQQLWRRIERLEGGENWKPKQPPPEDDEPLHIIQEAMLHFWL